MAHQQTGSNVVAFRAPKERPLRWRWQAEVLASPDLNATAKLVAVVLGDYFNAEQGDRAWPSQETIAGKIAVTTRTVRTALSDLVAAGYLENERPGGGLTRGESGILRGRTGMFRPSIPGRVLPG